MKKGRYSKSYYLTSIPMLDRDLLKVEGVLIILLDSLILLSEEKKKHKWIIDRSLISSIRETYEGILVSLHTSHKKYFKNEVEISIKM